MQHKADRRSRRDRYHCDWKFRHRATIGIERASATDQGRNAELPGEPARTRSRVKCCTQLAFPQAKPKTSASTRRIHKDNRDVGDDQAIEFHRPLRKR